GQLSAARRVAALMVAGRAPAGAVSVQVCGTMSPREASRWATTTAMPGEAVTLPWHRGINASVALRAASLADRRVVTRRGDLEGPRGGVGGIGVRGVPATTIGRRRNRGDKGPGDRARLGIRDGHGQVVECCGQ